MLEVCVHHADPCPPCLPEPVDDRAAEPAPALAGLAVDYRHLALVGRRQAGDLRLRPVAAVVHEDDLHGRLRCDLRQSLEQRLDVPELVACRNDD